MNIISRKEAKEKGLRNYFTGRPCVRGHIAPRRISDCICTECNRERCRSHYKHNTSTHLANSQLYYQENRSTILEHQKQKYSVDKLQLKHHYQNHDAALKKHKKWREENKGKVNALNAKRRVKIKQQTPKWAEFDKIRWLYEKATRLSALTGIPHHVDHIEPLNGKEVSGLHCFANLQILTASENLSKHNLRQET